MPHRSDPKSSPDPEDAVARRILDEVSAEPIPAKIVELAEKLDAAIAAKRPKETR